MWIDYILHIRVRKKITKNKSKIDCYIYIKLNEAVISKEKV